MFLRPPTLTRADYPFPYTTLFRSSNNPAPLWIPNDLLRLFKDHRVVGIPQNVGERDLAPMEALAFRHGSVAAYSDSAASLPPGINLDKSNEWAFDILEIFPNAVMFLSANLFRSEEHTSELQSLMRISYAVFCLKTKTH